MAGSKEAKRRYYERNRDKVIHKSKEWRVNNRERYNRQCRKMKEIDPELAKRRARGYSIKRKYGITLDEYEEILNKQNRCCAICDRHESEFKTHLSVDHNHSTREIRGLLCTHCNYRMVAKHTDGTVLRKIADYIEQGTGLFVPEKKKKKGKNR